MTTTPSGPTPAPEDAAPESAYAPARPIGDALIDLIDGLSPAELLGSVTPERLGEAAGFSASSVRYRLSQVRRLQTEGDDSDDESSSGTWSFDRALLWEVLVDALFARLFAVSRDSLEAYMALLQSSVERGDIELFTQALTQDIQAFSPGGTLSDAGGGAERARLLALTACEGSPTLTRLIRDRYREWLVIYEPAYELLLRITGRRLRPGTTIQELADPVSMFLQGVSERRRFDRALDNEGLLRAFLALVCAWTEPIDGNGPDDPVQALIDRFGQPSPPLAN